MGALDDGWRITFAHPGPVEPLGNLTQLHSQHGQDWLVASLLKCKKAGYFVDLAANDAMVLSNSLMLERDLNWNGVCIEANPGYHRLYQRRRCHLVSAVVASPTNSRVNFSLRGVFGGIIANETDNKASPNTRQVTYLTVALADVLKMVGAPHVIDYLSLDVEGAESMVMKDFPWLEYTFSVLTVERPKQDLINMLTNNGYEFLRFNIGIGDQTWVHKSLLSLEEKEMYSNHKVHKNPHTCMSIAWPKGLKH